MAAKGGCFGLSKVTGDLAKVEREQDKRTAR